MASKTAAGTHTIFVVDDHPVFREGLIRIINQEAGLSVCGEASDAIEALKQIESLKPELAIIDISLDGMNGIDLVKSIRDRFPHVRVLMLSMHQESLHAERALRAGANGYIMKKEHKKTLLSAIRQVLEGRTYVSDEFNEKILQGFSNPGDKSTLLVSERLSDRELEVFELIGKGYGTRQIADELKMSMKTVETHRQHIKVKLSLKNTFELVQRAIHWIHNERNAI